MKKNWNVEISNFDPNIPKILVGLKHNNRKSLITSEQGKEMANSIGCFAYYEANSLNKTGVNELFEKILQTAIDRHTRIYWETLSASKRQVYKKYHQNFWIYELSDIFEIVKKLPIFDENEIELMVNYIQ